MTVESHFDNPNIKAVASVGGAVAPGCCKGILAITGVDTWYKDIPNVVSIDNCLMKIYSLHVTLLMKTLLSNQFYLCIFLFFSGQNDHIFRLRNFLI